jgi:hypothetical protein
VRFSRAPLIGKLNKNSDYQDFSKSFCTNRAGLPNLNKGLNINMILFKVKDTVKILKIL